MTDYVLRARWIYMNEAERIEYVERMRWQRPPLITAAPLANWEFLERDTLERPDDIEDFARLVNTIYKYGVPWRSHNHIRLVLQIADKQYFVDHIQTASDVEVIFRSEKAFRSGKR